MISFIIVNYNTKYLTYNAILSIINSIEDQNAYEIIIVDNDSKDGSRELFNLLHSMYNNINIIYSIDNVGFAKANNIGFKEARGEYIYLLNSDAILLTKNIQFIIKDKFNMYENLGIIATKVYYPDGKVQPNVQKFRNLFTVMFRLLNIGYIFRKYNLIKIISLLKIKNKIIEEYVDNYKYNQRDRFIDWGSGCSLIFKREIFQKLNGFDEKYFMYNEDEDICIASNKIGIKVLYTPNIEIIHYVGMSNIRRNINIRMIKEYIFGEMYYFEKHKRNDIYKVYIIYEIITFIGYLFSKRLRYIRKYYKKYLRKKISNGDCN